MVGWHYITMRVHPGTALSAVFLLSFGSLAAAETPAVFFSVPSPDAPELAKRGPYEVGVRTLSLTNPGQPDILNFSKETGKAPLYDRPLTLEVWYPAVLAAGQEERTDYEMMLAGPAPKPFRIAGKAAR